MLNERLNERETDERRRLYATCFEMDKSQAPGLHQLPDPKFEIPTRASQRVQDVMQWMRTGSIGISGPRGVGKTTLIWSMCEGRLADRTAAAATLGEVVTAPVEYAARDFLLHLFAVMCRHVSQEYAKTQHDVRGSQLHQRVLPAVIEMAIAALQVMIVLAILIAVQLVLRIVIGLDQLQPPLPVLQRVPAASLVGPFGVVPGGAALATGALFLLLRGIALAQALLPGRPLLPRRLRSPSRIQMVLAVLLLAYGLLSLGLFTMTTFVQGVHGQQLVPPLLFVLLALIGGLSIRWLESRRERWRRVIPQSREERMVAAADDHLRRIQFQQTVISGWSGSLKMPNVPHLPFGLEGTMSRSTTLAETPWTLPELIADFRSFVGDVAALFNKTVVIGIDELDKIESGEKARQFINDIKAVFRVPGVFFLVSVSEDAMDSFDRRGLPFRDDWDSAFDMCVRVDYMQFEDARQLMNRRVFGMPIPLLGLAFVVSGGLPRELIRAARDSLEYSGARCIGSASAELVRAELASTTQAVMRDIPRLSGCADEVARWAAQLVPRSAESVDLLTHCRAARNLGLSGDDDDVRTATRLVQQQAAYEYFCATVMEFFQDDRGEVDWVRAETQEAAAATFDHLARARQQFVVSPELAWALVTEFRQAWELSVVGPDDRRKLRDTAGGP